MYPIIHHWCQKLQFTGTDSDAERLSKFRAALAVAGTSEEDTSLIARMLSIPVAGSSLSPQLARKKTLGALARHMAGVARQRPTLMVLEDAHWADPSTLELFEILVHQIAELPALLIVSCRTDWQPSWVERVGLAEIVLGRLLAEQAMALAAQVATANVLPVTLLRRVAAKADGVPLFIEELTKTVLASAASMEPSAVGMTLTVPSTLQAALTARLDRNQAGKIIAQVGAVIGRDFRGDLLAAVAPLSKEALHHGLGELVDSGLILRRGAKEQAVYTFRHALLRDAAVNMLLRDQKRELHTRVARVMEQRFQTIVQQQPQVMAYHYTQAGMAEQAIAYWIRAARKSTAQSASAEAAAQIRQALNLLPSLTDGRLRLRMETELKGARAGVRWDAAVRRTRSTRPSSDKAEHP